MLDMSFLLWRSSAVTIIDALILLVEVKVDLPALAVAMVMSLFGHGIELSGDYIILF